MRYENPLYMAEDAGAADIIAGGRLQLGISRGSPEQVIDGWRHFGYTPAAGESHADMARRQAEVLLEILKGEGFARPNPRPMVARFASALISARPSPIQLSLSTSPAAPRTCGSATPLCRTRLSAPRSPLRFPRVHDCLLCESGAI
jgi:alkanesulfonate monooxygenase SsuD/methylene tetrahydromethanopterin reductase-like flavin-dependent oxidoreductase (luciferase family)